MADETNTIQPVARRRLIGGLVALVAAVVAVAAILLVNLGGSGRAASGSDAVAGAATVQRRDLVSTDTESGTLSYANPQTVYDGLSGTITWLPSVGQLIEPGQTLYQVDGRPVVLFDGTVPAYRDLSPADSDGLDVLQLNQDLVKMGFADGQITVDDAWQAGTTDAVERWQGSVGETETGTITLGQIVFLPGTQRISAVDTTLGSNGAGGSAAGSGSTNTSEIVPGSARRGEFVSLTSTASGPQPTGKASPSSPSGSALGACKPTVASSAPASAAKRGRPCGGSSKSATGSTKAPSGAPKSKASALATQLAELKALEAILKAQTLALQRSKASSPSGGTGAGSSGKQGSGSGSSSGSGAKGANAGTSGSGSAGSGTSGSSNAASSTGGSNSGSSGGGGTDQPILATTSNKLVVTVQLDATKQSEAIVGAPVTVELPDGSTVNGKITQVSSVAQTNSNSGSSSGNGPSSNSPSATVPVTITLSGHQNGQGLDQAAVSVNFEQQIANNVLSVPVTALLATQGGGYDVQEAAAPHALIPVATGLFAAGYVQISGPGIYAGLQVTDSQG